MDCSLTINAKINRGAAQLIALKFDYGRLGCLWLVKDNSSTMMKMRIWLSQSKQSYTIKDQNTGCRIQMPIDINTDVEISRYVYECDI